MIGKPVYVTRQGLTHLQSQLERCMAERLEIVERLEEAKTGGDWMDSAEHTLVEDELAFAEARIQELEAMLADAQLIPPDPDPARVNVGDTVLLRNVDGEEATYTIVGTAEADPAAGFISNECPLARALLGRRAGDEITFRAPAGMIRFRLIAVYSNFVGHPAPTR